MKIPLMSRLWAFNTLLQGVSTAVHHYPVSWTPEEHNEKISFVDISFKLGSAVVCCLAYRKYLLLEYNNFLPTNSRFVIFLCQFSHKTKFKASKKDYFSQKIVFKKLLIYKIKSIQYLNSRICLTHGLLLNKIFHTGGFQNRE